MFGIGQGVKDLKAAVGAAKSDGKVDKQEFAQLSGQYKELGSLEKYAARSWLAGEHPNLANTITDPSVQRGYSNFSAVSGR